MSLTRHAHDAGLSLDKGSLLFVSLSVDLSSEQKSWGEVRLHDIGVQSEKIYSEAFCFLFWSRSSVIESWREKKEKKSNGQRWKGTDRNEGTVTAYLGSLSLGEGDGGLGSLSDDEHVRESGGEGLAEDVGDVDNVEPTEVSLLVGDHSGSSHVSSAGDHDNVSGLELDVVDDRVLLKVELDGVVHSDDRVRVSDRSSVVGDNVGDSLGAELDLSDLAELVRSLLGRDSVDGESALDVVEDSEVLSRLLDRHGVHESKGEGVIGSDLTEQSSKMWVSIMNDDEKGTRLGSPFRRP